jgi:hypothetical protein
MTVARYGSTATLLPGGNVLVAGGGHADKIEATAELYDPAKGTFTATGSMDQPRDVAAAATLPDGRVLVAGGTAAQTAALFDPATDKFSTTTPMAERRTAPIATALADGSVLVAGGHWYDDANPGKTLPLATAELYEP